MTKHNSLSGRNPCGLRLGERVTFDKVATTQYGSYPSEEKTLKFEERSGSGVVCGVRYKCEGERIPSRTEWDGMCNSYKVGPEFRVTRRHLLYLVHETLTSKPILVHPDHIHATKTQD